MKTLLLSLIFVGGTAQALTNPGPLFTYEGILTDSSGTPINTAQTLTLQVLYSSCVVYAETQSVTPDANGNFSVIVGSGSRTDGTGNTADRIFAATGTVNCDGAAAQTLSGFTNRTLHIRVGGTDLTPDVVLNNVPVALNAQRLNDKQSTDFVLKQEVNGNTSCNSGSFLTWDATTLTFGCVAGAPATQSGTDSAKPASPTEGTLYFATDTSKVYQYSGGVWTTVNSPSGGGISALTGDVSASGAGSVAATVNSVAGSNAADIHSAEVAANAATSANAVSTIVKRDATGGFSAGTITANLTGFVTGAASANILKTGDTMTGHLTHSGGTGDVYNAASGGNGVTLQGPSSTMSSSYVLKLPLNQGGVGQVLSNDGSGNLSWITPVSVGSQWNTSGSDIYYSTGNVGIGNSAPSEKLEVTGNIKGTQLCIGTDCRSSWPSGSGGTVTSIVGGAGLTGGTITTSGTLAVDVGTSANQIVQLDSAAKLPAVDGSALTNLNATSLAAGTIPTGRMPALTGDVTSSAGSTASTLTKIQGKNLAATSPANGDYLKYNGTSWVNDSLSSADLSDSSSLIKSSQMPANCAAGQTLTFSSPVGSWICSNIVVTASNFSSQTQNTFLAAPNGGSGTPTFRAIAAADLPSGTLSGSGTAGYVPYYSGASTLANSSIYQSGGNIGIGTTSPQDVFDVAGNIKAQSFTPTNSLVTLGNSCSGKPAGAIVMSTSMGPVYCDSASSGNWKMPGPWDISSGTYYLPNGNKISLGAGISTGSVAVSIKNNVAPSYSVARIQGMGGQTGPLLEVLDGSAATKLTIDSTGNVGIGTTTPTSQLTVQSNGTQGAGAFAAAITGSPSPAIYGISSLAQYTDPGNATQITGVRSFVTNISTGTIATAIALDGTVSNPSGGTITTGYGLHIGNIAATNKWSLYASDSTAPSYFAGKVGIGTDSPAYTLHVNGSVAGTSSYNNLSDRRLKENIVPLENSLEKILSLRGVSFDWRQKEYPSMNFDRLHDIGVIAQEVETVFPEAVTNGSDGFKTVAYAKLVAPLIQSTKELYGLCQASQSQMDRLDQSIKDHDRRISSLEEDNQRLKQENAAIKSYLCAKDSSAPFCAAP